MKAIMLATLLIASTAFAGEVSDVFNSNIKINKKSIKCSLFGKLKMKVKGLEAVGPIATRNLKATSKFGESCRTTKGRILELLNRRAVLDASVEVNEILERRTIYHDRHDRDIVFPRNYILKGDKYYYVECETYKINKLDVELAQLVLNGKALRLKRTETELVSVRPGHCR
ncbi:MAG: hypothetical protein KC493_14955 [Bacteriovoracaceae bacterium]|nr:hypothetical protein [Bacteriovoracaceae bacterium]